MFLARPRSFLWGLFAPAAVFYAWGFGYFLLKWLPGPRGEAAAQRLLAPYLVATAALALLLTPRRSRRPRWWFVKSIFRLVRGER